MKKKDLIYVFLAVAVIAVAAYLVMTQLAPKPSASKSQSGSTVDVIGVIDPTLSSDAISQIQDSTKVRDYSVTIDLSTGLGNSVPFGR